MEKMMLMKEERCLIKNISTKIVKICLFPMFLSMILIFNTGFYYNGSIHTVELNDVTIEIGDELPDEVLTYVGNLPGENYLSFENNVPKDEDGFTTKIGEYTYQLVYNDLMNKFSKVTGVKAKITVVDTVAPVIKIKEENLEIKYGSEIDIEDVATCSDLSSCTIYFEEEINTSKSGEYEVDIVAIDEANNTSYEKAKVTVLKKPVVVYNFGYSSSVNSTNYRNNLLNNGYTLDEKNNLRYQIVEFAKLFIGNPYVYGGTSLTNGTDCSGFTMGVYGNFGYSLPRVAASQGYVGIPVSESELLPGDLVVYYYPNGGGHVGIYAGGGMMVHAGTAQTGIVMAPMFAGYRVYRRVIY